MIMLWEVYKQFKEKINYKLVHIQQEDKGFRKNKILNEDIRISKGELIIFIDHDCIIHLKILEEYAKKFNNGAIFTMKKIRF